MELFWKYWSSSLLKKNIKLLFIVLLTLLYSILLLNNINRPFAKWDEQTNVNVILTTLFVRSNEGIEDSLASEDLKIDKNQLSNWNSLYFIENGKIKNFYEKPPLWYNLNILYLKIKSQVQGIDLKANLNSKSILELQSENYELTNISINLRKSDFRVITIFASMALWLLMLLALSRYFNFRIMILTLIFFMLTPHLYYLNAGNVFSTHTLNSADLDSLMMFFYFSTTVILYRFHKSFSIFTLINTIFLSLFTLLGFLTKGIMIITPIVVFILLQVLLNKRFHKKKKQIYSINAVLKIILRSLLPIVLYLFFSYFFTGKEFIDEFINYHTLLRAFSPLEGHEKEFFFYFINMLNPLFSGLTSCLLIFFILVRFKTFKKLFHNIDFIYFFVSFFIPLVIITIVQTRIAWYVNYIYPSYFFWISIFFNEILPNTKGK